MNDTNNMAYRERFTMVCDYIALHLDEPFSLEKLSALACCSPYHFHRQFLAFSGMPLYRYIQWLRLRLICRFSGVVMVLVKVSPSITRE